MTDWYYTYFTMPNGDPISHRHITWDDAVIDAMAQQMFGRSHISVRVVRNRDVVRWFTLEPSGVKADAVDK